MSLLYTCYITSQNFSKPAGERGKKKSDVIANSFLHHFFFSDFISCDEIIKKEVLKSVLSVLFIRAMLTLQSLDILFKATQLFPSCPLNHICSYTCSRTSAESFKDTFEAFLLEHSRREFSTLAISALIYSCLFLFPVSLHILPPLTSPIRNR